MGNKRSSRCFEVLLGIDTTKSHEHVFVYEGDGIMTTRLSVVNIINGNEIREVYKHYCLGSPSGKDVLIDDLNRVSDKERVICDSIIPSTYIAGKGHSGVNML